MIRLLDLIFSIIGLVVGAPWLLAIYVAGLLDTGSPLFLQERVGRNRKPFTLVKFRTMRPGTVSVPSHFADASAITSFGVFLRRTKLDELPQLWNVLKGEMSIVGPRPHMLKHTDDFSKIVEHYMIRQFLKPGITGWAQINSFRGEITNQEQIKMRVASDLWYLENWNIWLDLRILFLTIYHVFKGDKNAY